MEFCYLRFYLLPPLRAAAGCPVFRFSHFLPPPPFCAMGRFPFTHTIPYHAQLPGAVCTGLFLPFPAYLLCCVLLLRAYRSLYPTIRAFCLPHLPRLELHAAVLPFLLYSSIPSPVLAAVYVYRFHAFLRATTFTCILLLVHALTGLVLERLPATMQEEYTCAAFLSWAFLPLPHLRATRTCLPLGVTVYNALLPHLHYCGNDNIFGVLAAAAGSTGIR